jgi:hypothetical protein
MEMITALAPCQGLSQVLQEQQVQPQCLDWTAWVVRDSAAACWA